MQKRKILISGAGSIGIFLGALLAEKYDVKLFGKRKLRSVGEKIIINNKKYNLPEKIFGLPKNEKFDFIFITTKLYDFEKMIGIIKRNNIKGREIVAVQNGLVDTSKHFNILKKKIVPVVVFSGFNLKDRRIITNPTKIGWITEYSRDGKEISKLLSGAGILCKSTKNFDSLRAEKIIVNSCLNGLSAIENKPFYNLFRNKKTLHRINKIFDETYDILGKEYELKNKEKMKEEMVKAWSKLKHYSSTCQDILSGRRNEVKFFNGYIVKLGKKYNLPIQENKSLLKEFKIIAKNEI